MDWIKVKCIPMCWYLIPTIRVLTHNPHCKEYKILYENLNQIMCWD